MVNYIENLNLWLGKHLKYIFISLIIILMVLIPDSLIKDSTRLISSITDFLRNTIIIVGVIIIFSISTSKIVESFNFNRNVELNDHFKKYLVSYILLCFILVGIILNFKYGNFTQETEEILRNYKIIDSILNFFRL